VARDEPHVSVGGMLEKACLENNTTNEADWTKKESAPHFEEKQHARQEIANVDKPSHVRVRVLGCIVRVLTQFCNINRRDRK
jgi:hypothetical protein